MNRQPPACKAGALPIELRPRLFLLFCLFLRLSAGLYPYQATLLTPLQMSQSPYQGLQWAYQDSNLGPRRYQRRALTN